MVSEGLVGLPLGQVGAAQVGQGLAFFELVLRCLGQGQVLLQLGQGLLVLALVIKHLAQVARGLQGALAVLYLLGNFEVGFVVR